MRSLLNFCSKKLHTNYHLRNETVTTQYRDDPSPLKFVQRRLPYP